MPGRGASQAPVRFEDVIVPFSREEWRLLKVWQKNLYWEVLKDTYKALLSAGGSPVTKCEVLAWFEQCEHQNLKGTWKSRNGDSSGSSFTSNGLLAKMCHEECTEEVRCFTAVQDRSEEVTAHCGNVEGASEHLHMSVMRQGSPLRAEPLPHTEYKKIIHELARFAYSPRTVTVSKSFECSDHGERLQRKGLPQIRQKISTKNVSFCCPECGMGFPSNSHLRMHWKVHIQASLDGRKNSSSLEPAQPVHPQKSQTEKLHLCAVCGKSFQKYLSFLQHQKRHDDPKPQPCAQCEVVFMFQSDLEIHEESHLEESMSEQATCGKNCICDISLQLHFASQLRKHVENCKSDLQSHKQLQQKAQHEEKPYSCSQCEQQFTLEVNLEAHYRYHHKEWLLKRQLNCSVPNALLQHKKVVCKQESSTSAPGNGIVGFSSGPPSSPSGTLCSCSYCGKLFVSKYSLHKHQKRHNHGDAAKCDRNVSFRGGFGGSPLAHAIKKLHSCQECGKKFVYKWQLGMHLKGHAQEKQPLSLHCENILMHKADLGQHRKVVAKRGAFKNSKRRQNISEPALAMDQGRRAKEEHSQCEECGKIVRKYYLPQHQAVHAGLRHKCLLCAKICVFRSGALNHLRRHWQKGDFAPCYESKKSGSSRLCTCMIERIYIGRGQQKQQYALDRVPRPREGSPTKSLNAEHGQSLGVDSNLGVQSHGPSRGNKAKQVLSRGWKSELKRHRNCVPRKFKCSNCGKEFASITSLMMHLKMHKSKQLYPCNECDKNFISSFYLDMHRKRHAKESA